MKNIDDVLFAAFLIEQGVDENAPGVELARKAWESRNQQLLGEAPEVLEARRGPLTRCLLAHFKDPSNPPPIEVLQKAQKDLEALEKTPWQIDESMLEDYESSSARDYAKIVIRETYGTGRNVTAHSKALQDFTLSLRVALLVAKLSQRGVSADPKQVRTTLEEAFESGKSRAFFPSGDLADKLLQSPILSRPAARKF